MTNRTLRRTTRGAVVCLALLCVRARAAGPADATMVNTAESSAPDRTAFHAAVRRSLRGQSYTLVAYATGAELRMIEDSARDQPPALPGFPVTGAQDRALLLAGAASAAERALGVNMLGDFPDATALAVVTSALSDPDALVRAEAVDSLSHSGNAASTASLQLALHDPDDRVRAVAITAIAEAGAWGVLRERWDTMTPSEHLDSVDAAGDIYSDSADAFLRFAAASGSKTAARAASRYLDER